MGTFFTPNMYEDVNLDLGRARTGGTAPALRDVNSTGIYLLHFDIGEEVSTVFEIPHAGAVSTVMTPHVHFGNVSAPGGTQYVRFQMEYVFVSDGEVFQSATTINTGDIEVGSTAFETQFASFTSTITNKSEVGGQLAFTFSRIAPAGTSYSDEVFMLTKGLHFQIDAIGSVNIGSKT